MSRDLRRSDCPRDEPRATALLATSDKRGVVELADGLARLGWKVVATSGTVALLRQAAISVRDVEELIQLPPLLGGRVKTLHHRIFGGILARWGQPADEDDARRFDFLRFDLVACTFYPFEAEAGGGRDDEIVELIDIGGPAMLRAAAKNHEFVLPISDPADYATVLQTLRQAAGDPTRIPRELRVQLAAAAFLRSSCYDAAIGAWFARRAERG